MVNGFHMPLYSPLLLEALPAERAVVGPLSRVNSLMLRKVGRIIKPFVAYITLKRLFTRVDALVAGEGRRLRETLAANLAHERALARVDPQMFLQIRSPFEPFIAYKTNIGFGIHLQKLQVVLVVEGIVDLGLPTLHGSFEEHVFGFG